MLVKTELCIVQFYSPSLNLLAQWKGSPNRSQCIGGAKLINLTGRSFQYGCDSNQSIDCLLLFQYKNGFTDFMKMTKIVRLNKLIDFSSYCSITRKELHAFL